MKMRYMVVLALSCLLGTLAPIGNALAEDTPAFIRLGDLDGGPMASWGYGVSPDGAFVVGVGTTGMAQHGFMSSTETPALQDVGALASAKNASGAYAVSNDVYGERVVVGKAVSPKGGARACCFTGVGESWTFTEVGDFGGGAKESQANAVSDDGCVVVGYGYDKRGQQAFRWTCDVQELEHLGDGYFRTSAATAVSADGSIVVGYGEPSMGRRAIRWTEEDGMVNLGTLSGGDFSEAHGISPDGSVVVGVSDSAMGPQACIWYLNESGNVLEIQRIGGLNAVPYDSVATGVALNDDGTILAVVGYSAVNTDPNQKEAFIWTPEGGMDNLQGLLFGYDLEVGGWKMDRATGISADGNVISGWGHNPQNNIEAWVAKNVLSGGHTPEPE
jgi:probable HAF family extracellular repeat protein